MRLLLGGTLAIASSPILAVLFLDLKTRLVLCVASDTVCWCDGVCYQLRTEEGKHRFNQEASGWDQVDSHKKLAMMIGNSICESITLDKGMECMDFGCGTGLVTEVIADKVKSIIGIDNAEEMINVLNKKNISNVKGISIQLSTPNQLEMKFDLIFSSMAFHHIEKCTEMMEVLMSYLKPNGHLIIADLEKTPNSKNFHPLNKHGTVIYHGFEDQEMLKWMREAGFKNISSKRAFTLDKNTPNGIEQFGILLIQGQK